MATPTDHVVRALLAQLAAGGVREAVIAPGSRNTPLTLALTLEDSPIRPWLHLDERSAGYFALGLARQMDAPVALVCTSGTAAANFLPATVEANLSRVPLLLLTADRPPELRGVGAPQTIDQVDLYGTHVKLSLDLTLPGASAGEQDIAATIEAAARALGVACSEPPGPVHLNLPFSEPLLDGVPVSPSDPVRTLGVTAGSAPPPDHAEIERLAHLCAAQRGLIVAGPETSGRPTHGMVELAGALGWPILADPLSGLRAGRHDRQLVIDSYDVVLRDADVAATLGPGIVLRFGAAPTSKPLGQWLANLEATQILVDPGARWRDPDRVATERIQASAAEFASALTTALDAPPVDGAWAEAWRRVDRAAREAMSRTIQELDEPFEGRIALDLADALPSGSTLVAGNSMPVRDLDSFFPTNGRELRLLGTRGASGIDGVTSTAVGAAAHEGEAGGPVALFIGDLSFLHDLNGLWPVDRYGLSLTVLLANNDGGGIFHFLSQRQLVPDRFEEWWGTPHGRDLRHAVALHGGRHQALPNDGRTAIAEAIGRPGLDVLELETDRDRNVELHQHVWSAGIEAARSVLDR